MNWPRKILEKPYVLYVSSLKTVLTVNKQTFGSFCDNALVSTF